jgi:hypothetical protein
MKLKQLIMGLAGAAAIAGFTAIAFAAEEKEETITMDKVPQKVRDTLKTYAAESDVKGIEKGDDDGTKVFEFDIEQGTHKFEVAITPAGKFWGTEEDMELTAMPDAAQKALNALAVGGKISGGEKAMDKDKKVTYEAIIEKDGKKSEVAVDASGKTISTEAVEEGEGKEKD